MKKADKTKEKILDAALPIFLLKGYNGTSMRDLMMASGVKAGNFYFHFESKETLALAVLDRAEEIFFGVIEAAVGREGLSPVQKLGAMMGALVAYVEAQDCRGGCMFGNFALETAETSEIFRERTRVFFEKWHSMVAGMLSVARRAGEIPQKVDPDAFAVFIISAIEGGIMMSKLDKNISPLKNSVTRISDFLWGT